MILGTPGEEGGGGKIDLLEAGAFAGVDAAMMFHPLDRDVLAPLMGRLDVALQGHIHIREVLKYQTQGGEQRLITAAAVAGPGPGSANPYRALSGITLHRVVDGHIDDGTFLPLDAGPGGR